MTDTRVNWTPQQEEIVGKWIMILLAANNFKPIRGRLRIIKELFRIAKEISTELDGAIYFYKYNYGPYSSRAGLKMNKFRESGVISVKYTGRDWEYRLTDDYKTIARDYLEELQNNIRKSVESIKTQYQEMSSTEIVFDIYKKYPHYTRHSAIAKEVLASETLDPTLIDPKVDESKLVISINPELDPLKENQDEIITFDKWPSELR